MHILILLLIYIKSLKMNELRFKQNQQVSDDPSLRRSDSHLSPTLSMEAPPTEERNSTPAYRLPTGKEGSLKHRILRPPSINIVDPPPTALIDAPLSAPPIRSQRDSSPKHPRSNTSSGYRSFSSSASSLAASSGTSPSRFVRKFM